MIAKTTIPGNRYSETRIWSDTTLEFLQAELKRVVGAQTPTMRSNNRYVAYVSLLRRNIQARIAE